MKTLSVILLWAILSGCAVKQSGTRTVNFGTDGITVTSETVEADQNTLADVEKEKSVQECWKTKATTDEKMYASAKEEPMAIALIKQSEMINNLVSLAITRKPYNPCPSSTNSSDEKIADSEMYKSIYHDGFTFAGNALTGYYIYKGTTSVIDSLATMAGSSGTTITSSGSGDVSLFTNTGGAGSQTFGPIFSSPITTIETISP